MMELRWYQDEAASAAMDYIHAKEHGNAVVVIPTGAGKTLTLCEIINRFLTENPTSNVLILSHVKEILDQNHKSLRKYFPGFPIGLYSASLNTKFATKITVGGIQTVYNNPRIFSDTGLVIIDECHLVTIKQSGMYRKFLQEIMKDNSVYVIGLTATHFRLGHGYIHKGKDAFFTDLIYDLSSFENFNRLVNEGYLCNLISKKTEMELDTDGLSTRLGDFVDKEMSEKFDREEITNQAVSEIIKYGKNYRKWLVFAIDIEHAEHITAELNAQGVRSYCVHSKMEGDRESIINAFKRGEFRALVNVNILTTGFDVPDIDLIAMLRPTQSPVIHVQAFGRGLRTHPDKRHCLVLDFAGNTERLGPINDVYVKQKGDKKGVGKPITKTCPECGVIHHPSVKVCNVCNHKFEFEEKLSSSSSKKDIIKTIEVKQQWYPVSEVSYKIHSKQGKTSSLKVTYHCGISHRFNEYICYDHKGYPKYLADNWVRFRIGKTPMPADISGLYKIVDVLETPKEILVDTTSKFPKIVDSRF